MNKLAQGSDLFGGGVVGSAPREQRGLLEQTVHLLQGRWGAGVDVLWKSEPQKGAEVLSSELDGRDGKGGSAEGLGGCRSSCCLQCDFLGYS